MYRVVGEIIALRLQRALGLVRVVAVAARGHAGGDGGELVEHLDVVDVARVDDGVASLEGRVGLRPERRQGLGHVGVGEQADTQWTRVRG